MPWKSLAQRAWGFTDAGRRKLGGDRKVQEWDRGTPAKLPERVTPKKPAKQAGK